MTIVLNVHSDEIGNDTITVQFASGVLPSPGAEDALCRYLGDWFAWYGICAEVTVQQLIERAPS